MRFCNIPVELIRIGLATAAAVKLSPAIRASGFGINIRPFKFLFDFMVQLALEHISHQIFLVADK